MNFNYVLNKQLRKNGLLNRCYIYKKKIEIINGRNKEIYEKLEKEFDCKINVITKKDENGFDKAENYFSVYIYCCGLNLISGDKLVIDNTEYIINNSSILDNYTYAICNKNEI